jgi:DNA-directed RNA polymerase specialized sigma subunit
MADIELTHARYIARIARHSGIDATACCDQRLGWVCETRTPWHEHPVHLRDEVDVRYLAAELGLTAAAPERVQRAPQRPLSARALQVRDLLKQDMRVSEIARHLGLSQSRASQLCKTVREAAVA